MPSIIVSQNPGGAGIDQRVRLAGTNVARPHGFGPGWRSIKLTARYSFFSATQTTITSSPFFAMGLCSGNTYGSLLFDSSTQHFVGVWSTGTQFTFALNNVNSNTSTPAFIGTLSLGKKVGTTFFPLTATASTAVMPASAGIRDRGFIGLIITKGVPNYTITGYWQNQNDLNSSIPGNGFGDPTTTDLWLQSETNQTFTYHSSYYTMPSSAIAVDEGNNGILDNIIFAWDNSVNYLEISDVYVSILA